MLALLLLQSIAGPPLPPELRRQVPRPILPCPTAADGSEIIVCGRPADQRLKQLPDQRVDPSLADRMMFRLPSGSRGRLHAFQSQLPGATSQGAAITVTKLFGASKPKSE